MRLKRQNDKLIFEDRPWRVAVALSACASLMGFKMVQFVIDEGWTWDNIGLALGTLGFLAAALLTSGPSRMIFDKSIGQMRWQRRLFLKRSSGFLPLSAIVGLHLDVHIDPEGERTWRGVLELANGRTVPMAAGFISRREGWARIIAGIARFLGVPEPETHSLKQQVLHLLKEGRRIDAIKLYRLEFDADLATAQAAINSLKV